MSSTNVKEQPAEIASTPHPPAPAFPDVIRAVIQRIRRDKILLGLIIVGVLAIFVGGVCSNDEPAATKAPAKEATFAETAAATQIAAAPATPAPAALDPGLASQFVKWWLAQSMDYAAATAKPHHTEAARWMTAEAAQGFQSVFWTPAIEQEVLTGRVVAAFQPVTVQSTAINPDGSVVVSMTGTLVMQQANTAPMTQQIATDFLVKQEKRVCVFAGFTTGRKRKVLLHHTEAVA